MEIDNIQEQIAIHYGHRLRLRVCGLCFYQNKLLLIKHLGIGKGDYLWIPPGGGVQYGESSEVALKREFLEETGLSIEVLDFKFGFEIIRSPLHAVELFFDVRILEGELEKGKDPETVFQTISEVAFLDETAIFQELPLHLHSFFAKARSFAELRNLRGWYREV
ncbi:MAG: NUDIX hydrolase [Bernardetiaceae bacterium]|nr:NUDIX hydrolase [Bernardetiaceae bacterium]